jgi:hypothetical protein
MLTDPHSRGPHPNTKRPRLYDLHPTVASLICCYIEPRRINAPSALQLP